MYMYELSLRDVVSHDELCSLIGEQLGIDKLRIGSDIEYWERAGTATALAVGVEISWTEKGFRTFLKWVCNSEITNDDLLIMAKIASQRFGTEVAVGDVRDPMANAMGLYLVFTPLGEVFRAHETSNSDVFEVAIDGIAPW
jgi:hypothetical protein